MKKVVSYVLLRSHINVGGFLDSCKKTTTGNSLPKELVLRAVRLNLSSKIQKLFLPFKLTLSSDVQ